MLVVAIFDATDRNSAVTESNGLCRRLSTIRSLKSWPREFIHADVDAHPVPRRSAMSALLVPKGGRSVAWSIRRGFGSKAGVGFGPADPVPQRLVMHAQLRGQFPDRRLGIRLPVQLTARALNSSGYFFGAATDELLPILSDHGLELSVKAGCLSICQAAGRV